MLEGLEELEVLKVERCAVRHFVVGRLFTACGNSQQLSRATSVAVSQIAIAIVPQRL